MAVVVFFQTENTVVISPGFWANNNNVLALSLVIWLNLFDFS